MGDDYAPALAQDEEEERRRQDFFPAVMPFGGAAPDSDLGGLAAPPAPITDYAAAIRPMPQLNAGTPPIVSVPNAEPLATASPAAYPALAPRAASYDYPQPLRTPTAIPRNAEPAPVAPPVMSAPAGPAPSFPAPQPPAYTGSRRALQQDRGRLATQALNEYAAAYAANPSAENKEAYDRAELARKELTGSGISQIRNPLLRGLARVGATAVQAVTPRWAAAIPGTELHHNLQVARGQGTVGQDVAEAERLAQIQNFRLMAPYRAAEARRAGYLTPRQGGVFNIDTNTWVAPPNAKDLPADQRKDFAAENADMFQNANERNQFVLYGKPPQKATANINEWQLRIDAANGDEDAQRALDQRLKEEKQLANIRANASKRGATPGEIQAAEVRRANRLRQLDQGYHYDTNEGGYVSVKDPSVVLTPEEMENERQTIQDFYEDEMEQLGQGEGAPRHGGTKPSIPANPYRQDGNDNSLLTKERTPRKK